MSYISFHLSELFWRFFYPLLFSFFSFFLFGNYFKEVIYFILCQNAHISFIIISNPFDGIYSYLSLAIFLSIFLIGLPLFTLNLYFFIRPSLIFYNHFHFNLEFFSIFSLIILPLLSIKLALIILPYAIKLLLSPIFGHNDFSLMFIYWVPQINSIISLFITLTIFTLLYLIIPIILIFIQIKFGNPKQISIWKTGAKYRQITILIVLLTIAIITPPDLISLLITGIPLIVILEGTFYITLIVWKYSGKKVPHHNLPK